MIVNLLALLVQVGVFDYHFVGCRLGPLIIGLVLWSCAVVVCFALVFFGSSALVPCFGPVL